MSSMAELMEKMKAKKATLQTQVATQVSLAGERTDTTKSEVTETKSSLMDKLDTIRDTPIDYIGETIDSSPRQINIATEGEIIKNRILRLSEALEKEIPDYAHILHVIHKSLSKDDELCHLLSDEEVGILIRAMKLRKSVVLVEEKKKVSNKKPLSKTTLDDIL